MQRDPGQAASNEIIEQTLTTYLVGGAVRDQQLGIEPEERDWVVVGSSPEQMRDLGFRQVGQDFPVFLHPHSHEEFALARTERKSSAGHTGFIVHAAPDITLEQDLKRRDLTINAIARSPDNTLIDPYGGLADIENRVLRHVSTAFAEDPLRVLRVARFAATFAHMGFHVAPETLDLMQTISANGELETLPAERIWTELMKAFSSSRPSVFFEVLRQCNALKAIFPELDALFGIPQTETYHPEIDTGVHTMMVVDRARSLSEEQAVIFAALTHDLGKALTPARHWPRHHGHESRGVAVVDSLCERLKAPKTLRELARVVCEQHLNMHRLVELKPATILKLLGKLDAFRKPERLAQFTQACQADAQGRGGSFAHRDYPQAALLCRYFEAASSVNAARIADQVRQAGRAPAHIKAAIEKARIQAIADQKRETDPL